MTKKDAYIPEKYLEKETFAAIGKDYQRIANRLQDEGKEIEWTAAGPVSIYRNEKGEKTGELDVSFMFMYPNIIMENNVSPD